ncbi:MAG TPA: ABC transporter permease [Bryobacteraceae bacterium]
MNLRHAYRFLLRTPGFALFAILELALGIGLTTTAFFVVNAVLLRPLDLPEPSQLVQIQPTNKKTGKANNTAPGLDFRDLRDRTSAFTSMAAYWFDKAPVLIGNHAEQVHAASVSRGWVETIGLQPILGASLFSNANDETAALISARFWKSRMGGDPDVLNRRIQLWGKVYSIRGVMPDRVKFPDNTDVWVGMVPENDGSTRTAFNYRIVGRLKPGVTRERGKANLASVAAGLEQQYPENKNRGYTLVDLRKRLVGSYRSMLYTLGGAVLLVLLIACANVSNLLLARALNRRRELAIRMALGAHARHLFAVVLSESLLISAAGGSLGLLLAVWLRGSLIAANPFPIPRLADTGLDQTVVGFAVLASIACGMVTGVFPAWRVWRSGVQEALVTASSRTTAGGSDKLRSGLLIAEVAFSVLLLVGAGLLLRSFSRLASVDPGFRTENLAVMECDLSALVDEAGVRRAEFYEQLRDRALSLPGVSAAAWHDDLPAQAAGRWGWVLFEGRPKLAPSESARLNADWHIAGPGYFHTLGVPVLAGREFTPQDNRAAPEVAIVNAAFVRTFFPNGENPLGARFHIGLDRGDPTTIVGVTGDVRQLAQPAGPQLFLPYLQYLKWSGQLYLTVRAQGPAAPLLDALRKSASGLMPEAVVRFTNMQDAVAESVAPARFRTILLAMFSAIALALALTGLYAVCSFLVQTRTREIGLRMALGAGASAVVRQFIGHALRLTAVGLVIGIAGAFALRTVVASFLFETPASDWFSYAGSALVLALGSVLASLLPAWRASRTDPAVVLREE